MSDVKRKKGETFDALLRRFQRRTQQSGRVIQAKKVRFRKSPLSKAKKRMSALHRISAKKKLDYLGKIGKLPPEAQKRPSWK